MKKILVIDIPDEMCDDYDKWYLVSGDEIQLKYEEDGALMHYKNLGMNLELKPLPKKRNEHWLCNESWDLESIINAENRGWNACIDEIVGEEE